MKKTSRPIVFFGNERLATGANTTAPTLTRLIEEGYDVKAVVASNDFSASRKQRILEVAEVAQKHNIPLLLPKNLKEISEELRALKAEIGVLVAYGKMVPQSVIDIFPYGIVNIHPSLLPLHRGPTPIESVILRGEQQTGVSLMKLVKAMDAGPVYDQKTVSLKGTESKQQLADTLLKIGSESLLSVLPAILESNIEPKPQNDSMATYDNLIDKKAGYIDWQKPAIQLEREIRAYATWPGSRTTLAGKEVIITRAHVDSELKTDTNPGNIKIINGTIAVSTKNGTLIIECLKPAGKPEMAASAFIAGHKQRLIQKN